MNWCKFNPVDFLDGVVSLTPEERGCYITVLMVLYSRDGQVEDNPRYLAGMCGVTLQRWTKVRAALIVNGKLYATDRYLRNGRVDEEVRRLRSSMPRPGRKVGQNSGETGEKLERNLKETSQVFEPDFNENKDLFSQDLDIEGDKENPPKGPPKGPGSGEDGEDDLEQTDPWERDAPFMEAWSAYPSSGRERSSRKTSWRQWKAARKRHGAEKLVAAVRRYVSVDQQHKKECGAPAFDRWLRDERFEHWFPAAGGGVGLDGKMKWAGPAKMREEVLKVTDDGFVSVYLDTARWIAPAAGGGPGTIVAKTAMARDKLIKTNLFRATKVVAEADLSADG